MTISLSKLNCTNCDAPLEWDGTYGKSITCAYCGSTFLPGPTNLDDLWLFTNPVARARLEFSGTLNKLEQDIRYEVLRGGTWSALDRECKRELDRLAAAGVIRKLASFWAISPFSPVYRARQHGELFLDGRRFPFSKVRSLSLPAR